MNDWWVIGWWAGMGMGLAALVVIAVALFRDRSRGRRRCPKCWYDMSGVNGLACPECGRTQRQERRFFRTRRRWRPAAIGLMLLVVGVGTVLVPAFRSGKWARYTPVPVLRVVLLCFPDDAAAARRWHDSGGRTWAPWQRMLLAHSLSGSVREALDEYPGEAPIDVPHVGPGDGIWEHVYVIGTLGEDARPALPELARALAFQPTTSAAAWAHASLGAVARANIPALRDAFIRAEDSDDRTSVLLALIRVGATDQWLAEQAKRMLKSAEDAPTRLDAIATLLIVGAESDDVLPLLKQILAEGSPEKRVVCVRMLGLLAGSSENSHVRVPAEMIIASELFGRRLAAPRVSGGRTFPAVEELIRAAADDEDPEVRRHARDVLAGLP